MTDPSSEDGDERPNATADGGGSVDGSAAAGPTEAAGPPGPTESTEPTDPAGAAETAAGSTPSDGLDARDAAIAVGTAIILGVLGPLIALTSGLVVFGIGSAVGGLSVVANVVLTLLFGQYVAFGGLALLYLRWRGLDRSGVVSYLGVRRPSPKEIGLVIVSWIAILITIMVVSLVVQALGTEAAPNQSAELAAGNPAIIPLLIAASFLVIGPCEELLYRGVVQGRLRETLPAVPSILIASGVFAFIHVMALTGGVSARLTTVTILFFPSLVFGAVYEYTDNLVVPALLHGLHNAVIFTILYISVTDVLDVDGMVEGGAMLLPV